MEYVSRALLAAQYRGDNGQELLDICQAITQYTGNAWSIAEQVSGHVVLREVSGANGQVADWPVHTGQWMVVAPDFGIVARVDDGKYQARYRSLDEIIGDAVSAALPTIAGSQPMQQAIAAEARKAMYGGFGVGAVPLLIGGATSSPISVPLRPVQPDAGYTVSAHAVSGVAVLSSVDIASITKAADKVTLTVKNTGVAALSGLLLVHVGPPIPGAAQTGVAR